VKTSTLSSETKLVTSKTYHSIARRPVGLKPGERWRSSFAADPSSSRKRLVLEEESPTRSVFQRDRDRIIHSTAFRRLKHKTQVFLEHEGDHYRTRLTHTIEVAQIARSIARSLGLDEDLAETLALAHDLGHTPFGHAGERALDRAMADYGGFDHNAQSLKVVTSLEKRYAGFDGLNLTWETLEGLVKHNGPLTDRSGVPVGPHADRPIPQSILDFDAQYSLELWTQSSTEAQAAAISDDIAYNAHDIDDGLRAKILSLQELEEVPFLAELLASIRKSHPNLDQPRTTHELQRRIITKLVEDAIQQTWLNIETLKICDAKDIREAAHPVVSFSDDMRENVQSLRAFLYPKLYRHPRIMAEMTKAEKIVEELFQHFLKKPSALPEEWQVEFATLNPQQRGILIGDFIAGMTDRYAIDMHSQLVGDA
jgi:dGTPase